MPTLITHQVKITVETAYQNTRLVTPHAEHMHAYKITIVNQGDFTVKLLRRQWFIFDSLAGYSEVEGEGVVGQTPVLEPGEMHQYVSGCAIQGDIGSMKGNYLMERQLDGKKFFVQIPQFILACPFALN